MEEGRVLWRRLDCAGHEASCLRREDDGWRLEGEPCPRVAGCVDVDLNFSPSTNLLPIRRLDLAIGARAPVRAAWVRFPSFRLEPLDQVYRRTGAATYRYESAGGSFLADLEVDEAGFVTRYPGFAERVECFVRHRHRHRRRADGHRGGRGRMGERDPRVDAYIAKAAPFARPILDKLRTLVHQGCSQVEETIKWGVPHFEYKGLLLGMAAFKEHVGWGFWKSKLMQDPRGIFGDDPKESPFAMKPRKLADLPPDEVFLAYLAEAVRLNDTGAKLPRKTAAKKAELEVPADLRAALAGNAAARETFDGFSYSNRKDYVEWLTEAKREATRKKRLATAIAWLAEGKPRNWKYMKKWQS